MANWICPKEGSPEKKRARKGKEGVFDVGSTEGSGSGDTGESGPQTGIIRIWVPERKMGFIKKDAGGEDIFCHASSLVDGDGSVNEGDAVTFYEEFDDREGKCHATKVRKFVASGNKGGGIEPEESQEILGGLAEEIKAKARVRAQEYRDRNKKKAKAAQIEKKKREIFLPLANKDAFLVEDSHQEEETEKDDEDDNPDKAPTGDSNEMPIDSTGDEPGEGDGSGAGRSVDIPFSDGLTGPAGTAAVETTPSMHGLSPSADPSTPLCLSEGIEIYDSDHSEEEVPSSVPEPPQPYTGTTLPSTTGSFSNTNGYPSPVGMPLAPAATSAPDFIASQQGLMMPPLPQDFDVSGANAGFSKVASTDDATDCFGTAAPMQQQTGVPAMQAPAATSAPDFIASQQGDLQGMQLGMRPGDDGALAAQDSGCIPLIFSMLQTQTRAIDKVTDALGALTRSLKAASPGRRSKREHQIALAEAAEQEEKDFEEAKKQSLQLEQGSTTASGSRAEVTPPPLPLDEAMVTKLMEMGFERPQVEHCLRAADGNAERAVEYLMAGV